VGTVAVDEEILLHPLENSHEQELKQLLLEDRSRCCNFIQVSPADDSASLRRFITECQTSTSSRKGLYLGIFVHGNLGGQVRFELKQIEGSKNIPLHNGYNVAYLVASKFNGRAIAYRVMRALIPFAAFRFWSDRKISQFEAEIHKDNLPSEGIVSR
jgi:hypothetical protein